jgi:hypothetical protein
MMARTKTTSGTLVAYELRWNGGRSRRQFGHVTDDEFTELNPFSDRKDNTMRCISTSPTGRSPVPKSIYAPTATGRISPAVGLAHRP